MTSNADEIEMRAIAFVERQDLRRLTVREQIIVRLAVSFTFRALRRGVGDIEKI
jgi:hypothetical protein